MRKYKLAVITSHPIQYQTPLFKKLSQRLDLMVYFFWDFGVKETFSQEFGRKIKWDIPLLEGYRFKFLKNFSLRPSSEFLGQVNFGIINELKKNKYDAVLVFGWNSFANWLAFLTAFILKIPVLLRGENPLNQELLKSNWKRRIKKVILGWLFRRISAFLYIGEENRNFYKYYGVPESKLFFVPYAIDNDRFISANNSLVLRRNQIRKRIGISEKETTILFVGKLIDKKRPMDLLKAYELLVNRLTSYSNDQSTNNIHLLFVGDGVLREELENYSRENNLSNVYFTGFKNQTELPEFYAISDIFVLPSGEGETWGLVVNEAMCFGLPIIVSDRVGCGINLVKDGENGYIFPLGDSNRLFEKIKIILDKKNVENFGKRSFEIIKKYSYDADIEAIINAVKSL